MLYIQYHGLKKRYDEVEKEYQDMLKSSNDYICSIEMFKRRMEMKKENRDMLLEEVNKIKEELYTSRNMEDKIYYYCWIEEKKINKIYRIFPCCKSSLYIHKNNIEKKIKELFETI